MDGDGKWIFITHPGTYRDFFFFFSCGDIHISSKIFITDEMNPDKDIPEQEMCKIKCV